MRLIAFALFFISWTTYACPNLSGTYALCKSSAGDSRNFVVTQNIVNRVTVYTLTGTNLETGDRTTETIRADGKIIVESGVDPETGMKWRQETTGWCEGSALKTRIRGLLDNEVVTNMESSMTRSGPRLITVTKGTVMDETFNSESVCE